MLDWAASLSPVNMAAHVGPQCHVHRCAASSCSPCCSLARLALLSCPLSLPPHSARLQRLSPLSGRRTSMRRRSWVPSVPHQVSPTLANRWPLGLLPHGTLMQFPGSQPIPPPLQMTCCLGTAARPRRPRTSWTSIATSSAAAQATAWRPQGPLMTGKVSSGPLRCPTWHLSALGGGGETSV